MTARRWGRLLLGVGSLAALAISPVFALSYYPAYGGALETPPGWLAYLVPRFTDAGWLGSSDPEGLYSTYGLLYCAFLAAVTAGLNLLLRSDADEPRWTSGGRGVVVAGFALATLGTFGDYSGVDALMSLFLLELVGALVIAVGTVMIGVRLWRSNRRAVAWVGLIGPLSLVLGSALLGHFPSGPLSIDLMAGAVAAAIGLRWLQASTDSDGERSIRADTASLSPEHVRTPDVTRKTTR